MTALGKQTTRLRRAAAISLLLTVPLAPLTACGGGDDSGGGADSEQGDDGEEDDGGAY